MDLAYFLGRAWELLLWFTDMVIGTVAGSIFGGWVSVLALAIVALILFLATRVFAKRSDD